MILYTNLKNPDMENTVVKTPPKSAQIPQISHIPPHVQTRERPIGHTRRTPEWGSRITYDCVDGVSGAFIVRRINQTIQSEH